MYAFSLPISPGPSAFEPNTRDSRRDDVRPGGTTAAGPQGTPIAPANANGATPTGRASDSVTISPEAQRAAGQPADAVQGADDAGAVGNEQTNTLPDAKANRNPDEQDKDAAAQSGAPRGKDGEPLSDEEVKQVDQLQARDAEVRRHEQAHAAAGGPYVTSGPTYEYQEGPDGRRYAVGGSVGIDTSPEETPEATITKAQVVRRAALAPAEPSAQDRRVAAKASQMEQQARAELAAERSEEAQQEDESEASPDGPTQAASESSPTAQQPYAPPAPEPALQVMA